MAMEGGGICPSGESNFVGDSRELLFWPRRLFLGESVVEAEKKLYIFEHHSYVFVNKYTYFVQSHLLVNNNNSFVLMVSL